ncbi:ectoine/hydroxyectoine ABC transporter permease subunit EhuD [Pelomicrobium sp.]|uniref:ectoine/hydroxyectoine ABC transporter permease subunit EhuD n=1 Tax=Pelomicrobium sp. TaxID=2815319 RepID=UPI002FDEC769
MIFDWAFALEILPQLARALAVTVQATLGGMLIALTLGLLLAIARRSRWPLVRAPVAGFVEFVRSTPLLVQIYFLFYGLPALGVQLSAFTSGVLALGLHYGTYCSEVYRAGLDGVSRGQWEAAAALNMNRMQTYIRIVIPQAIPPVVPALGNYLIAMFKDTPLLSAITVLELLQSAKMIGAETFRYTEPLTLVGMLFLAISLVAAAGIRALERRLAVALGRTG